MLIKVTFNGTDAATFDAYRRRILVDGTIISDTIGYNSDGTVSGDKISIGSALVRRFTSFGPDVSFEKHNDLAGMIMFHWRVKQSDFAYVAQKIAAAPFSSEPFRHVYIPDLFSAADFRTITEDRQIRLKQARSDAELIERLHEADFKEINFPGTTTDLDAYLAWHRDRLSRPVINQDTCEGFGMTLRLQAPRQNSIIEQLREFLGSDQFWDPLYNKFGIDRDATTIDFGIQKYLDGYEISPHPDIRKKALTFMVNINPLNVSERLDHHTHYMKFIEERDYVRDYWAANPDMDRCWVPWSWCRTVKQQTVNNSMVIFAPSDDTLHAVRARYDHLSTQRTQLYGNIWFKESKTKPCKWQQLPQSTGA